MEDIKRSMTYKEYYNFISNEINTINKSINVRTYENNNFNNFCKLNENNHVLNIMLDLESMYNCLKDSKKKNIIINSLKAVFGTEFFDDFDEEKYKRCKEKGLFCKDDIDKLLKDAYGKFYGYDFSRPNSYDELASFLLKCFEIFNNSLIKNEDKKSYIAIIYGFKALIENKYMDNIAKKREAIYILDKYNEFKNAYNEFRKVNISQKDHEYIKFVLNKDERKFIDARDGIEKPIGLGDVFLIFISDYNMEHENFNKSKNDSKINLKVDNYYNKIKKISVSDLENKNLPKYSNKNFIEIMKKLISNFEEDLTKDEAYLPYYTLLMIHQASFYKSKYYKDNYILKQNSKDK